MALLPYHITRKQMPSAKSAEAKYCNSRQSSFNLFETLEDYSFLKQQTRINFHQANTENAVHLRIIAKMPDSCTSLKLITIHKG